MIWSTSQLAELAGTTVEAIRVLDAELEATVGRLERIRGELALILTHRAPA